VGEVEKIILIAGVKPKINAAGIFLKMKNLDF